MTKKETLILVGTLLGFWVIGAILFLPWTHSQLRKAASTALSDAAAADADQDRFANVDVTFSGQIAKLSGTVESEQDVTAATEIVREMRVPVFFGMASPKAVTAVKNHLETGAPGSAPDPDNTRPPAEIGSSPFVTASRYGDTIRLDGSIASAGQKYAYADAIKARYDELRVIDMVEVDEGMRPALYAEDVSDLPDPSEQAWFAASKLDGEWTHFPGSASDEQIAEGLRTSFRDRTASLGGLSALRNWQENQIVPEPIPPVDPPPPTSNVVEQLPPEPVPPAEPPPAEPPPAEPLKERVIARLTFNPNAARAEDKQMAYALRLVQNVLRRQAETEFLVVGHSDSKGAEDVNIRVSTSRAQIVVDYLIANGIDAETLKAEGRGEAEPIGDNDTEAGRQQNRRVEIIAFMNSTNP